MPRVSISGFQGPVSANSTRTLEPQEVQTISFSAMIVGGSITLWQLGQNKGIFSCSGNALGAPIRFDILS
jgi:hypothetical protein